MLMIALAAGLAGVTWTAWTLYGLWRALPRSNADLSLF